MSKQPQSTGQPMHEDDDDRDELAAEVYEDVNAYLEIIAQEEIAKARTLNVVPIRPEIIPQHTDDELVPLTPGEILMERLVFDPEAALIQAASETWVLDDLIPSNGIGFIYGPPGSYKSFIALDMALSVTTGRPWHGFECETPGAVIYIAAEGSRGLMERAVAWKRYHKSELGPFMLMTMPVMMDDVLMAQAFIECMEKAQAQIGQPIRMMVVDTMARSFSGDENSAQEIGAFIGSVERVAAAIGDCFVMVIGHTGKDKERGMRGSSAMDGASYASFMVTKTAPGQALVKNTKQKDIEMAEPMRFAMERVSTGIADRKGRIRHSLVPILESQGDDADPEAQDDLNVFDHRDGNVLVGMVKAAESDGRKLTEDDLRKEFVAYLTSEGKKADAARKTWQRTYQRARDQGAIMKAGAFLHIPGKK